MLTYKHLLLFPAGCVVGNRWLHVWGIRRLLHMWLLLIIFTHTSKDTVWKGLSRPSSYFHVTVIRPLQVLYIICLKFIIMHHLRLVKIFWKTRCKRYTWKICGFEVSLTCLHAVPWGDQNQQKEQNVFHGVHLGSRGIFWQVHNKAVVLSPVVYGDVLVVFLSYVHLPVS